MLQVPSQLYERVSVDLVSLRNLLTTRPIFTAVTASMERGEVREGEQQKPAAATITGN
jgi:hypothetical protein